MQYLDQQAVTKMYRGLPESYEIALKVFGRPLTLTEKILSAHFAHCCKIALKSGPG